MLLPAIWISVAPRICVFSTIPSWVAGCKEDSHSFIPPVLGALAFSSPSLECQMSAPVHST